MIYKSNRFQQFSKEEMKNILGGKKVGGIGVGGTCRAVCNNGTTYDCFSESSRCSGCSAEDGVGCKGYDSDCKMYEHKC
jgi:hypothetical protein